MEEVPRSPPRLAELQSEKREATSSNLDLPEMMSSRKDLSWETAASLVVFEMMRPSGSFHDDLRLDPSCLMSMCDALTWFDAISFSFLSPGVTRVSSGVGESESNFLFAGVYVPESCFASHHYIFN